MIPLLVLLFVSFLRPSPASATCSPKECGNLTIAYPFWLEDGDGQPPCGSPLFQIRCDGGTQALLAHSIFGLYQVLQIFTENSSLIAVDHNFLLPPAAGCPVRWFNVSDGIGLGPYTISGKNRELLVLYNCTEQPGAIPEGFIPTPCRNGSSSFFRLGERYDSQHRWGALSLPPACGLSVVPVLGFPGGDEYVGSMKGGFLLEWTVAADNCPKCVASGGHCSYATEGFSCNCSDALYPDKCDFSCVPTNTWSSLNLLSATTQASSAAFPPAPETSPILDGRFAPPRRKQSLPGSRRRAGPAGLETSDCLAMPPRGGRLPLRGQPISFAPIHDATVGCSVAGTGTSKT